MLSENTETGNVKCIVLEDLLNNFFFTENVIKRGWGSLPLILDPLLRADLNKVEKLIVGSYGHFYIMFRVLSKSFEH